MGKGTSRKWWVTWPGAITMGFIAFVLASPGLFASLIWLVLPQHDNAGTDMSESATAIVPVMWRRIIVIGLLIVVVGSSVLTAVWARRRWAGYVLMGLVITAVIGIIGLFWVGFL